MRMMGVLLTIEVTVWKHFWRLNTHEGDMFLDMIINVMKIDFGSFTPELSSNIHNGQKELEVQVV